MNEQQRLELPGIQPMPPCEFGLVFITILASQGGHQQGANDLNGIHLHDLGKLQLLIFGVNPPKLVLSSPTTLPETNSLLAPENRPKPKRKVVFQPSIFRGKLLVSGRVTIDGYAYFQIHFFGMSPKRDTGPALPQLNYSMNNPPFSIWAFASSTVLAWHIKTAQPYQHHPCQKHVYKKQYIYIYTHVLSTCITFVILKVLVHSSHVFFPSTSSTTQPTRQHKNPVRTLSLSLPQWGVGKLMLRGSGPRTDGYVVNNHGDRKSPK